MSYIVTKRSYKKSSAYAAIKPGECVVRKFTPENQPNVSTSEEQSESCPPWSDEAKQLFVRKYTWRK